MNAKGKYFMEKIYTAQEVAQQLKIKKTTVYELIKRGELQATKVGKQLRISQTQLDCYLGSSNQTITEFSVPAKPVTKKSSPIRAAADSAILQMDYLQNDSGLIISGQTAQIIELLKSCMEESGESYPMLHSYMNSYNSLYSLYCQKTHLALICLPCQKDGTRDYRLISGMLPGISVCLLTLCHLQLGIYIKKGNPKNISGLPDFCRSDIITVNRECGCECRILLDDFLKEAGCSHTQINGYQRELLSHLSVAGTISSGQADAGIGDLSQLNAYPDLEGIPLIRADLVLVCNSSLQQHPAFPAIQRTVSSRGFQNALKHFGGYDTSPAGDLITL